MSFIESIDEALLLVQEKQDKSQIQLLTELRNALNQMIKQGLKDPFLSSDATSIVKTAQELNKLGGGTLPDNLTLAQIMRKHDWDIIPEWKNFYARLDTPKRIILMGALGKLYNGSDNWKYFHSELRVEEPKPRSLNEILAKTRYQPNPDIKGLGFLREKTITELMQFEGVGLKGAIVIHECFRKVNPSVNSVSESIGVSTS